MEHAIHLQYQLVAEPAEDEGNRGSGAMATSPQDISPVYNDAASQSTMNALRLQEQFERQFQFIAEPAEHEENCASDSINSP